MDSQTFPNESPEYRKAREELLRAESGLRDQLEAVAELRRKLPQGGAVKEDYVFEERRAGGQVGEIRLSELFAPGLDSLLVYGFMYGPQMEQACPMCTSFLDSLNGASPHLSQRMNIAVCARSPIDRIVDFGDERGWSNLHLISSAKNGFQSDYLAEGADGSQLPMANIFTRREGVVRHFWGSELLFHPYPSGNSRHVDMLWPLWNVLDLTPEGRSSSWYPALRY